MTTLFGLFNLGGGEIVLILALVLILFGARKLPELAKGLGQGIKEFKKASREAVDQISLACADSWAQGGPVEGRRLPRLVGGGRRSLGMRHRHDLFNEAGFAHQRRKLGAHRDQQPHLGGGEIILILTLILLLFGARTLPNQAKGLGEDYGREIEQFKKLLRKLLEQYRRLFADGLRVGFEQFRKATRGKIDDVPNSWPSLDKKDIANLITIFLLVVLGMVILSLFAA